MPVYVETKTVTLPYPGLRPFRRDEFEIFFGREEHVAKLAEMLQENHFVAVVGPSGCGKSSLVTAGLLPQLDAGHAVDIEGRWYEATIRPGDRPFSRLAEALVESGVLPDQADEDMASHIGFLDAELRRGPLGLIHTLEGADSLCGGNLLIVVDQFEEIFRFRNEKSNQEADAFVALLLETVRQAEQQKLPIYVMLTMRSDYLGDCNQFSGLPEAISESQFLTPRPNREQRHAAIDGPAAMFGGEVEPALVNRLLNDMGDDPDQLPIMQHALTRMWTVKSLGEHQQHDEHQQHSEQQAAPAPEQDDHPVVLTTEIYDEVGGWHNTLSNHADEAFDGLGSDPERQRVAEMLFRSLTQRGPNQNDVRRPVAVREVAEVAGVPTQVVKEVVDAFRRLDRCFLTPGLVEGDDRHCELDDDDILDISHESLIRQWDRLREWAENEGESAADYARLEDAALRWKSGAKGYLQSPELDVLQMRYKDEDWTEVWARRYGADFKLAIEYLEKSQAEKQRLDARAEAQRNELIAADARAQEQEKRLEAERARADEETKRLNAEAEAQRIELAAERERVAQQTQTVTRFRRYIAVVGVMSLLFFAAAVWAVTAQRRASREAELARLAQIDAKVLKYIAQLEADTATKALANEKAQFYRLKFTEQGLKDAKVEAYQARLSIEDANQAKKNALIEKYQALADATE